MIECAVVGLQVPVCRVYPLCLSRPLWGCIGGGWLPALFDANIEFC